LILSVILQLYYSYS